MSVYIFASMLTGQQKFAYPIAKYYPLPRCMGEWLSPNRISLELYRPVSLEALSFNPCSTGGEGNISAFVVFPKLSSKA